jgi:NitT/TauT family transport system substrate-binding protein
VSRRDALLAVAAAAFALPRAASAQSLTTIELAGVPEDSITPALYAQKAGLFRRYGVDVHIQPQRSGPAIASGVAGGAYQIGKASVTPIIIAHSRNVPFLICAAGGLYDAKAPIAAMLVKADSPYKTAADLNGKTIAVFGLNDIFTVSDKLWIDQNGGDSTTVKLVEIPVSAIAEAILLGRIDAGAINEPELAAALATKKLRVLGYPFNSVAPRFMYTAWFTTAEFAAQHRAAVNGFARAMREAAAYANGHHSQTVDLLSDFTKIDAGVIRTMTRVVQGTSLDPQLVQPVIDATARYKGIPASFDAHELFDSGLS